LNDGGLVEQLRDFYNLLYKYLIYIIIFYYKLLYYIKNPVYKLKCYLQNACLNGNKMRKSTLQMCKESFLSCYLGLMVIKFLIFALTKLKPLSSVWLILCLTKRWEAHLRTRVCHPFNSPLLRSLRRSRSSGDNERAALPSAGSVAPSAATQQRREGPTQ